MSAYVDTQSLSCACIRAVLVFNRIPFTIDTIIINLAILLGNYLLYIGYQVSGHRGIIVGLREWEF